MTALGRAVPITTRPALWLANLMSPHQPIGRPKLGSPPSALALENEGLMAEGRHLGLGCGPAPEQEPERCESGQKGGSHAGVGLTHPPAIPQCSRDSPDPRKAQE